MWKPFFELCDLLCRLIPSRELRRKIRSERLYDWRRKYNALRAAFPELNFRHTKMIKGGWNIGFIVDKKYVFKIRKAFDKHMPVEKIMREKRITDAFASVVAPIRIPKIDVVNAGEYTFFKYDFIPGKNMNRMRLRTITRHRAAWGAQIGEFIYRMHNAMPHGIDDLRGDMDGDGWNHNDICNNIIVDKKSMRVVGIIDWEYAGWGTLDTELQNATLYSEKMQKSGISGEIIKAYNELKKLNKISTVY